MLDPYADKNILEFVHTHYNGDSSSIVEAYFDYFLDDYKKTYNSDFREDKEWLSFQDRERFLKDIIANPELGFYIDNPLIYSINKWIHRSTPLVHLPDEIDVFLGDSTSFGEGVIDQHMWVNRLGEYIDFPYYNGSLGGSGIMTWYRTLRQISSFKTIRNLYILGFLGWPRYEYYDPYKKSYIIDAINDYGYTDFEKAVIHDANLSSMYIAYHTLIKDYCKNKGIKLYFVFNQEVYYYTLNKDFDNKYDALKNIPARDLMHPNPFHHAMVFETFKHKISKDPSI